jgi:hypothetical protein
MEGKSDKWLLLEMFGMRCWIKDTVKNRLAGCVDNEYLLRTKDFWIPEKWIKEFQNKDKL